MNETECYELLANAIVVNACKDWRRAARRIIKKRGRPSDFHTLEECTEFFKGDWIKVLTNVDGNYILHKLREELVDEAGYNIDAIIPSL